MKTMTASRHKNIKRLQRSVKSLQKKSDIARSTTPKSLAVLRARNNVSHTKAVSLCSAVNPTIPCERTLYYLEKKIKTHYRIVVRNLMEVVQLVNINQTLNNIFMKCVPEARYLCRTSDGCPLLHLIINFDTGGSFWVN